MTPAVPNASPTHVAAELASCVTQLGFKGAMLSGRIRNKNLDHPDFWPLFQEAATLGVPLFIHPQIPQQAMREALYSGFGQTVDISFATFGLGWHYEAGIQFMHLMLAGVFDAYPDLQIILSHWGDLPGPAHGAVASLLRTKKEE